MKTKSVEATLSVVTITKFAKEINRLHKELWHEAETSLVKAKCIGEMLSGIRDTLNHGEWLPWLKSNVEFSDQTARNYIRVYESNSKGLLNFTKLGDFYKSLQPIKPTEPEKPEPEKVTAKVAQFVSQQVPEPETTPCVSEPPRVKSAAEELAIIGQQILDAEATEILKEPLFDKKLDRKFHEFFNWLADYYAEHLETKKQISDTLYKHYLLY